MKAAKKRKYLSIVLGAGILAFAIYNVHSRCELSEGGVLGLSLLIYHWFHISPGISCFIMDSSAMLLGTLVLKKGFLGDSILASACYAVWYLIFERFDPILPDLSQYHLAAAVLGGVLVGIGAGMVVRHDCAAGGDDSLALVFHKLTGRKVSAFYVISDFSVLIMSLSYIPLREIAWSMLSVLISSGVIELLRGEISIPEIINLRRS